MAHFAHIENGKVDAVIVIEKSVLEEHNGWYLNGALKPINEWVQTSYNVGKGEYKIGKDQAEKDVNKMKGTEDDVKARNRKNYAGIGDSYDSVDDMFIPSKPFELWKLNKDIGDWEAPKPMPEKAVDEMLKWNEEIKDWEILTISDI